MVEFTSRDIETIGRCAQSLVDIINESKELALTSNNPETKISRLQLAQDKLKELKKMARQYPFLKLFELDEVEMELSEISFKIQQSGYVAIKNTNDAGQRAELGYKNGVPFGFDNQTDIMNGYQFSATMQIGTPLKYLEMHGQINSGPAKNLPQVPQEHGIWLPKLKSWAELGISGLKEPPEGTMASDIGQIPTNGGEYLNFLKAFREIVESNKHIEEQSKEILLRC